MTVFSALDLVAIGTFLVIWGGYSFIVDQTALAKDGLNRRMHAYREIWMQRMLEREQRMVDMQIMAALQNGTAFFASTSLIAIGGSLALLRSTDEMIAIASALPLGIQTSRVGWEAKTVGLAILFIYAFFKFAWSYRLYNYVAILLGATPFTSEKETPEAAAHVLRTARLFTTAGRHFNRGQRAFFFSLAYLGWFAGPVVFLVSTVAVLVVMWRRQFASDSLRAVADQAD
jgi:uncharacterized membrane protein